MEFIKHACRTFLFWVMILVLLVHYGNGQATVSFTVNFDGGSASCTSGDCNDNQTYVPNFACSDGRGEWNDGTLEFMDPIPPNNGYVLWNVTATAYGRFDCNGTYSDDLLGIIIIDGIFTYTFGIHFHHYTTLIAMSPPI
jgi:hypothetical protein